MVYGGVEFMVMPVPATEAIVGALRNAESIMAGEGINLGMQK